MLSLDPELFQTIVLGLLVMNLLVLLLTLSTLSRVKKEMTSAVAGAVPQAVAEAMPAALPVTEPQPVAYAQPEPQPVAYAQPEPQAAAAEPEEQPFERDGRWWFRRGGELLVYDEQSGQWQPAPAATSPDAGPPAGAGGDFWKCPNCGAVNGSTATSCRMCFTART